MEGEKAGASDWKSFTLPSCTTFLSPHLPPQVSPDAALQMSYQLAYSTLHPGSPPATYESCATRNYYRGRTETIRSLSSESSEFVNLMREGRGGKEGNREAFQRACGRHIELAKSAKGGLGVDRILLAMRKMSEERGRGEGDQLWNDEIFQQR